MGCPVARYVSRKGWSLGGRWHREPVRPTGGGYIASRAGLGSESGESGERVVWGRKIPSEGEP